jgi:hypothetical protein
VEKYGSKLLALAKGLSQRKMASLVKNCAQVKSQSAPKSALIAEAAMTPCADLDEEVLIGSNTMSDIRLSRHF